MVVMQNKVSRQVNLITIMLTITTKAVKVANYSDNQNHQCNSELTKSTKSDKIGKMQNKL